VPLQASHSPASSSNDREHDSLPNHWAVGDDDGLSDGIEVGTADGNRAGTASDPNDADPDDAPELDLAGNPRPAGTRIDLGADELPSSSRALLTSAGHGPCRPSFSPARTGADRQEVPRRIPRRRLIPAIALLVGCALLGPTAPQAAAGTAAREVTMRDNRFDPVAIRVAQGRTVEFTNFGRVGHDARDGTGLDLFATELLGPPETASIEPLPGAGDYRYYCTFHPEMVGSLRVPVRASHTEGAVGARVTVRWAAVRPPAGLVFDVQRRRPGADRFVDWRVGASAAAAVFRPSERGLWTIRARVRQAVGDASSGWSPVRAIRIT